MPFRSKTIRRLPPTTRKLAKMANQLETEARRLRALIPVLKVYEDVYGFVSHPKDTPEGELPQTHCPDHGDQFDSGCIGCADSFFGQGLLAREAAVTRDALEVQP